MERIELNSQGEAVKRFFLSLPVDAAGSLIELNGQAVARVSGSSALLMMSAHQSKHSRLRVFLQATLTTRALKSTVSFR